MRYITKTRVIVVAVALTFGLCVALLASQGYIGGKWENPGCREIRQAVAANDAWFADPNAVAPAPGYSDANNPSHWYSDGCQGPVPT